MMPLGEMRSRPASTLLPVVVLDVLMKIRRGAPAAGGINGRRGGLFQSSA
jgi:hypothetical protein